MRWRLVMPFAALAVVIVIVAAVIAGAGADPEGRDDAPVTVTTDTPALVSIPPGALGVEVGDSAIGRAIPPGFLGFSIEYSALLPYAGYDPRSLNPTFLALVRNLNPGQSPVIRIGGDTTDWSWWPTPGVRTPPGVTYTITGQWLQVAHAMAAALGARLIPGIQFEDDSRRVAAAEADALLKTIGRKYIAAFELGNEPEVYAALGWYHTAAGVQVPGRKPGYDVAAYVRDFSSISPALPHGVPLAGPASGARTWLAGLGQFVHADPRVKIATFHSYALSHCTTNPRSPYYSTIPHLMEPRASAGLADSLAPAVTAAHAHHVSFRVDELNSVSCRGGKGVSDTFASSLWALDTLFNMARIGVDGVNIHTLVISSYMPFTFSSKNGKWSAQVKPLYYGLLMFARAAPPGSRLLPVSSTSASGPVHSWATRAPDGTVRVVLINDSRQRTVVVAPPGLSSTSATLTRLAAPGLAARSGVTLGGQSFGSSTSTGELGGTPRVTTLHPLRGRYVVALPSASAAMLTIQAG
jgi:hypothetical protein